MTRFRYWLADLISGGGLTRLSAIAGKQGAFADMIQNVEPSKTPLYTKAQSLSERNEELSLTNDHLRDGIRILRKSAQDCRDMCLDYRSALRQIAAEAKPASNATVKRMARIAQEALK